MRWFVTQKCKLVEKILGCYHLNETFDGTFVKYYITIIILGFYILSLVIMSS